MKDGITFAPAYVAFYPHLAQIARDNGYSLGIHGSVGRDRGSDFDLIAVPWSTDACSQYELIEEFDKYIMKIMPHGFMDFVGWDSEMKPTLKPHGRLAWKLQLGNGAALDISVLPPAM